MTALMDAASLGDRALVEYLLRAGADVGLRARDGRTAEEMAADVGQPETAWQLREAWKLASVPATEASARL